MEFGGTIKHSQQAVEAKLLWAYTGRMQFVRTRWKHCCHRWWALDYLNQGSQRQRIGRRKAFTRDSRIAALYAPGRDYYEWESNAGSIDASFVVFDAHGEVEASLQKLTGTKGYWHCCDPDYRIGAFLQQIAELVFYRRSGFYLLSHGVLVQLLGLLLTATPLAANLGNLYNQFQAQESNDMRFSIENFISKRIAEPLRVADLAKHAKMSVSAFAHNYRRITGESPYRTVQRLKLETAKHYLLRDRLTVKECAARLGFSSDFHFSRLFKRIEGLSPTQYRHSLLEKAFDSPVTQKTHKASSARVLD